MPRNSLLTGLLVSLLVGVPGLCRGGEATQEIQGLLDAGKLEQALVAADAALLASGDDPEVQFLKGVTEAELGRDDDAIATFEALTRGHPNLPEPHNNLAVLYAARGDFDKARDALLQAIAIHPSYAMAHENLGDIYARMAELSYRRAASLDAGNTVARSKLTRLDGIFAVNTEAPVRTTTSSAMAPGSASPGSVTPTSAAAPSVAVDAAELRAAVDGWAAAWSGQDVDRYLASYDAGFRPARGLSLARWREQRRSRLTRPSFIKVDIDGFAVARADDGEARVTFRQRYRSDGYGDTVSKELVLVRSGGQWKIRRERSLGAQ